MMTDLDMVISNPFFDHCFPTIHLIEIFTLITTDELITASYIPHITFLTLSLVMKIDSLNSTGGLANVLKY